ncbi:MAG: hypothetical protein P857_1022 [Candidatus Xenolissoclinum pacificiensis L6]|uniref:Uncharacterized protein n=1 Tax=Candidatus Xenolissoclinum pacificiensis L6 TaxID=1401685 RepID=W2V0R1_9RICK|nr:MAG: hypothetical protein P857_1022 [Candidatus Xenolissoclinum pacificiensis L6]
MKKYSERIHKDYSNLIDDMISDMNIEILEKKHHNEENLKLYLMTEKNRLSSKIFNLSVSTKKDIESLELHMTNIYSSHVNDSGRILSSKDFLEKLKSNTDNMINSKRS